MSVVNLFSTDGTWLPKPGDFFRIKFNTIQDRSYLGDIFECKALQDEAVVGIAVHEEWNFSGKKRPKIFVNKDVTFHPADKLWAAMQAEKAK